ncbi:MAG: fibronectin type III domain-containing protein [Vicinamibacterales bacterium]
MFRSLTRIVVCVLTLVGASATPALAQRIVLSTSDFASGSTDLIDLTSGATTHLGDFASSEMWLTATGEFLLRYEGTWRVRHIATGLEVALPPAFVPLFVHPRETVVYGDMSGTLTRLDPAGLHDLGVPCATGGASGMDMAPATADLFVQCTSGEVVVVDAPTGTVRRRFAIGTTGRVHDIVALEGGTAFLVLEATGLTSELRRVDAATGATLATGAWPPFASGVEPFLVPYPARDRVLAAYCVSVRVSVDCGLHPMDVSTLTPGGTLPFSAGLTRQRNTVAPDGAWLVVSPQRYSALVHLPDGAVAGATPFSVGVVRVATGGWPPLPPLLTLASVTSRGVMLTWSLPVGSGAATTYRLEAGFAPGATAVSIDLGAAASTTIPGVPPGRYYARIRAVNFNGVSAPSNEIVIDVP